MAKRRAIGQAISDSAQLFESLALFLAQQREREKMEIRAGEREFDLSRRLDTARTADSRKTAEEAFDRTNPLGLGVSQNIDAATSIEELPTPSGVMNQLMADKRFGGVSEGLGASSFPSVNFPGLGTREMPALPIRAGGEEVPPDERLLRQLLSRRGQLESQAQAKAERGPRIGPQGVQVLGAPGSEVRTEKLPSEIASQQNLVESGTRDERVKTAGATARASTPPTVREAQEGFVRINPFGGPAGVVEGATPVPPGGAQQGPGSDFEIVAANLPILEQLSQHISTGQGFMGQYLPGRFKEFMGAVSEDQVAQLFTSLREPTALALASIVNGGRPTEPDKVAAARLLPDYTTTPEVAAVLYANMKNILQSYQLGGYEGAYLGGSTEALVSALTKGLSPDQVQELISRAPTDSSIIDAEEFLRRGGGGIR